MTTITFSHLFFDVGGVLGTDGWDHAQRGAAAVHFGIDRDDMEERHQAVAGMLEQGRIGLDDYLRATVFHTPRAFGLDDFKAFMREQSVPDAGSLELARSLARTGRYRLMTLNNESDELNRWRIEHFGLRGTFSAFFTSCWIGIAKPAPRIYELALAMSQAEPAASVFIDDRERNLEPARALGMHAILFRGADALRAELMEVGVTA